MLCLYIMIHLHGKLFVIFLKHLRSILYESMVKIKIIENLAEKPPPCLFVRYLTHVIHMEYQWSPQYKSILRFLISKYLL